MKIENTIIVKTWSNGKANEKTGSGYGLRIGKKNRDKYFSDNVEYSLIIDNKKIKINITPGFYKECPEIRDKKIGMFLIKNKLHKWKSGNTNSLNMIKVDDKTFEIKV